MVLSHKHISVSLLLAWAACTAQPYPSTGDADPDAAVAPNVCDVGPSGGSCTHRGCQVEVPAGALAVNTELYLEELSAPSEIRADVVANRMCALGPASLALAKPAILHIAVDAVEIPDGFGANSLVPFRYTDTSITLLTEEYVDLSHFEISVQGAVAIGVTAFPVGHHEGRELGQDAFNVDDPVSYLQNLSSELFLGAYHDGTRFYLTNGGRVLIWNNGLPSDPTQPPDVVLGKPDLASRYKDPSASNIKTAKQVWSNGQHLVVTAENRVLIWNQIPTANFTPADIVLGQDSFTSTEVNGGGDATPSSMWDPDGIASDGSALLIADARNNRVLVWDSFPVLNNQPADHVIGQENLYQNQINGGAIRFQQARGVYLDALRVAVTSIFTNDFANIIGGFPSFDNPAADSTIGVPGVRKVTPTTFALPGALTGFGSSGFALRDHLGVRAAFWNTFPTSADDEPDFFLGKPDGLLGGYRLGGVNASSLSSLRRTAGLFANDSIVVVPDGRRALVWSTLPTSSYAPADFVIGQPVATTDDERIDYRGIGSETLAHPSSLSIAGEHVAVADRSNNRVLLLGKGFHKGEVIVVGQKDAHSYMPNRDWKNPSAKTLSEPKGVFTDGTRLVVADTGNNRVLIWNSTPEHSNSAADIVVGQPSFTSIAPNAGAQDSDGDGDSDASASSLHRPSGVWIQDEVLFVADTLNHRVLVYDPIPTSNGVSATSVLGQPDMRSNEPNAGQQWVSPNAEGLALPVAFEFLPSGELLIADQENNRVVVYTAPFATGDEASFALGQPDLSSNHLPNYLASATQPGIELAESQLTASSSSLRRPSGLAITPTHLYVADSENHRAVAYELPLSFPFVAAFAIGQETLETRIENENGIGSHSLKKPAAVAAASDGVLWIADTDNHRLLTYEAANYTEATAVHGQVDMLGAGINASSEAKGIIDYPSGTSWDGEFLWVADRNNHRVLAYTLDDGIAYRVVGQVDLGRNLPNAGAATSASSLAGPSDVYSNGDLLIVADRNNNRVLIWNQIPTAPGQPADIVLGQSSFQESQPNRGNGVLAPSADSLFAPGALYYDGTQLYVSDTGNNRVLIWDELPTANGTPADRALCQEDMTSNIGNQGQPTPSAATCAWPTGLRVVRETLYLADSLNNRVLTYPKDSPTGSSATMVLGQPDFTTRSPVADNGQPSAATMSAPADIDYDGSNLVIADTGNNRVLIYTTQPTTNGQLANLVLGQSTFTTNITGPDYSSLNQPTAITLIPQPFHSTRIIISDSRKDRLLLYEHLPRRDW